jgi:Cellulase M and related proteins
MIDELRNLALLNGPSGYEDEVRNYLKQKFQQYTNTYVDRIGNLIAKKGEGKIKVLVVAHMDEVGFIIQSIDENGFIKFTPIGGWDDRIVAGMPVKILGKKEVIGIVGTIPPHILKEEEKTKPIKIEDAFIDTGFNKQELKEMGIDVGTYIVPYSNFITQGDKIMCKALDDRVGCAILTEVLKKIEPNYELIVASTVQEELGTRGARILAYEQEPDLAIVVECTVAADVPNIEEYRIPSKLNNGAVITLVDKTMVANRELVEWAIKIAEKENIKYQIKRPIYGGTDAGVIHLTKRGIPCLVISCPARYIHSFYSMTTSEDLKNSKDLVISILENLNKNPVYF